MAEATGGLQESGSTQGLFGSKLDPHQFNSVNSTRAWGVSMVGLAQKDHLVRFCNKREAAEQWACLCLKIFSNLEAGKVVQWVRALAVKARGSESKPTEPI